MVDWGKVLTEVLATLLPLVLLAVLPVLITKAVAIWKSIAKDYPTWANVMEDGARLAVLAAEQLQKSGVLPSGEAAKAYAVKVVQDYLNIHGFKSIDVATIEAAVESAVWQYINSNKPVVVPPVVVPPVAPTTDEKIVVPVNPPVVAQG